MISVRVRKPPEIRDHCRGVASSAAVQPVHAVRLRACALQDGFPQCDAIAVHDITERVDRAAADLSSASADALKAENLPAAVEPQMQLVAQETLNLAHHRVQPALVCAENEHIVHVPQVMIRVQFVQRLTILS